MRRLLLVIATSVSIISCNSSTNNNTKTSTDSSAAATHVNTAAPTSKLNDAGTQQLVRMLADYYGLKDAMIALNANKTDSFANKLNNSAKDMKAIAEKDSIGKAIAPYLDSISMGLQQIMAIKDASCKQQQVPFSKVSDHMFAVLKKSNLKDGNIYLQHCPMALNEKGAHWVSNEAEIKNPYFPKTMIDCGDLEDSLK